MEIKILPSLLAADFGRLADEAKKAEDAGADALHLDIMDAHFVPNLSMGPDVVKMARKAVDIPLSVHLMMTNPEKYIDAFHQAGADSLLIHIEADCDISEALDKIKALGMLGGITLNPETEAETIYSVIGKVDEILCMTVHPGYGGQSFIPEVLPKIKAIRSKLSTEGISDVGIMVDGGIDLTTVVSAAEAGANMFVAGSSLYRAQKMTESVALMRKYAAEVFAS